MKLFIGSSSSNDIPEKYLNDCKEYLDTLFKENNELVFGASNLGIMGLSYDIAIKNKRNITGICQEVYKDDFKSLNCSKKIITNSIGDRTTALIDECDTLIFLPGGIGTIYELFRAIESKRSGEFDKPIIIYNSNHFYDELLIFLDKIYSEKFTSEKIKECYHISNSIEDTIQYLKRHI